MLDGRALDVMLYRMALGDPRPSGTILVGMGAVTQDALLAALRAQMHAKVDAVYSNVSDARVTFRMSRPLPKDALRVGTLLPRDFLHGRKRKRDKIVSPRQASAANSKPWWSTTTFGTAPGAASDTPPPPSGTRPRASAPPPPPRVPGTPRTAALRTLGLPLDADEATVRRAFKRLAMELHPDRYATSPEDVRMRNAARFAEASAAYHLLVA
jgi:DnaJ-domain-containing protein 1